MSERIRPARSFRQAVVLVATCLVALGGLTAQSFLAPTASAAPGNPGTPSDPSVVFDEGFEHNVGATATSLATYEDESGVTYDSDPYWVRSDQCNGVIVQYEAAVFPSGYCTTGNPAQPTVRRLADVLGQVNAGVQGSSDPSTPVNGSTAETRRNHAVTAWTGAVNGPNNAIVFESSALHVQEQGSRFFTASIDVAEVSCTYQGGVNNSRLNFFLVSEGQQIPLNNTPIRACTDAGVAYYTSPDLGGGGNSGAYVAAGRYYSDGSYLLSPEDAEDMTLRMRNLTGSSAGNDFAYDNVRLMDATPQLDKSFSPASVPTGGTSTLTLTVTNTSELAAKNGWSFTDTLPDGLTIADPANVGGSCTADVAATAGGNAVEISNGQLAAGEASCTITVDVTSDTPRGDDEPSKTYSNCAENITAFAGIDLPACATVEFHSTPSLDVFKETSGDDSSRVGDTVSYEVTGTNSGTGDYTDDNPAVVLDDLAGVLDDGDLVPGSLHASINGQAVDPPELNGSLLAWDGALAAGETVTITYDVILKDGGDKDVSNVAFPSAGPYDPDDPPATPPCGSGGASCAQFTLPGITLEKSADTDDLVAGETITYSFTVTNTGKQPLSDITVNEGDFSGSGDLSAISCPETSLDPGDSTTCTATYEVTQADVDQGSIENSATSTGTPPSGDPVTSDPSDVKIPSDPAPGISLVKSADTDELVAGETITYSFVVTNTGNVTLSDVTVDEGDFSGSGDLSAISCPDGAASLAPGDTVTCTATYEVTQADVDRGSIENDATATGATPGGDPITSDPSEVTIPSDPQPGISLVKSADTDELVAGETITYSFVVTNTGNVTLTDVGVTEGDFTGSGDLSAIECPDGAASLAPGDQVTCTATYEVTQDDVDRGSIENDATATGATPGGDPITSDPSEVTIPSDPEPGISLVKSADTDELVAGETITYSFVVTNTGNVTLSDVTVNEGEFTGSGELSAIQCPDGAASLAPGDQVTCTATYEVTQDDVDRGSIENDATATGATPGGDPITSDPSGVQIPEDPAPGIALTKSADTDDLVAGETITYSFVVTNTGNVTLTDVTVNEGEFTGSGDLSAVTCPDEASRLLPGAKVTCTATYEVTQADVDRGSVENTATATGTPPTGDPVDSDPAQATVPADQIPALSLVKSADRDNAVAGETVTYSFVVTNTGNVTLTDVGVTEGDFTGSGDMSDVECPGEAASLAPGDSVTCTATYEVTQADVEAGGVTNTATAQGTPPGGDPVVSDPSEVTVPAAQNPGISLVKSADKSDLVAGETITYSFVVTNTGNVTLTDVGVTEGDFTGSGDLSAIECPGEAASLAPGDSVTCTATYEVTQADVDRGSIENTATAQGTPPRGGAPVGSDPSEVQIPQDPQPSLELVKSADPKQGGKVGDEVTYSFTVTNTGNVTLSDITIDEGAFTGSGDISEIACPESAASLAPGQAVTCTATYTLTQADVDAGHVSNTATAGGTPPGGGDPVTSDPSTVDLPITPAPGISLVKSADTTDELTAGETITYSFVITNTGNVTLTDVGVTEGTFTGSGDMSAISCPDGAASLAPGAQVTCTATYEVTQADVDQGTLENTATAHGTPPGDGGTLASDPSDVKVPQDPHPSMTLVKSADTEKVTKVGQVITYSFAITNTGNITINDVGVNEEAFSGHAKLSGVSCPDGVTALLPGQTVICTATYTVVADDLNGKMLTNVATATGTPPDGSGPVASDPSKVSIDTVDAGDPGGTLPITGSQLSYSLIALAILSLVGGAALVLNARRRRTHQ